MMAEGNTSSEELSASAGWWGNWISSARNKSAEVLTMVKKDLDEFGTAVRSEATHVYAATSSVIEKTLKLDEPESTANSMKKSISLLIGQVSSALNPEPDDEDTEMIMSVGDKTIRAVYKKELESLQRLDATYLVPPEGAELEAWRASVEWEGPGAGPRRLKAEPLLAAQYEKLVPSAVTEKLFWERYLFRAAMLSDRIAAAVRRAGGGLADVAPLTDPVLMHLPISLEVADSTEPSPEKPTETLVTSASETKSPSASAKSPTNSAKSPSASAKSPTNSAKSPSASAKSPTNSAKSLSSSTKSQSPDASKNVSPPNSQSLEEDADDLDEGVAWEEEDFGSDVELTEEQQMILLQEYEKEINTKKQQRKESINKSPNKASSVTKTSPNSDLKKSSSTNIASNKNKIIGNTLVEDHFKEVKDDVSLNSDGSWEKEFEMEETA